MRARPLTGERYRPFGAVLAAYGGTRPRKANMGTARRWDRLAPLENRRPGAKANLSVFRCAPFKGKTFSVKLLERHQHSTQVFLPLPGAARFLIVVARGGKKPDLKTLQAFVMRGPQGLTYKPGTWHHPMVALDRPSDLACLVYEDGTRGDCEVFPLPEPLDVKV